MPIFSHVFKNGQYLEIEIENTKKVNNKLKSWFKDFNALNISRTAGWTTAIGIEKVVKKLLKSETNEIIGSAILFGEFGLEKVNLGAPLEVNNKGIKKYRNGN